MKATAWKIGDKVEIYERPLEHAYSEGLAALVGDITETPCEFQGIKNRARARVRFVRDGYECYRSFDESCRR